VILNVSGRCDIVAFFTPWFINRYQKGYVDVRNPFNTHLVNRIFFSDVDLIMFCTKNPWPIINFLPKIKQKILFHVTLTPYKKDVEPGVIDKKHIIEGIKKISKIIGKENIVVRYDPIFLSQRYTLNYHLKAFKRLCELLSGNVNKIIVSFVDNYKNVQNNIFYLKIKPFTQEDYEVIGTHFSKFARENNITVQTCFEKQTLEEYGFVSGKCLSVDFAYKLTGKKYKKWNARNCGCAQLVDIGVYNTCRHFCKYCYANFDEKMVNRNFFNHDIASSLLVGHIKEDDVIKVRK